MLPADFINAIASAAQESMRVTGVPASVSIAQAALESAWGSSQLATQGFNLFGIKADSSWKGATVTMRTAEVIGGQRVMVNAPFRKYANWLGSINDHGDFLGANKRYAKAFKTTDGEAFAKAIADAGYATDPEYAQKLISTMRARNLAQYDKVA
jgi:flagellar protein FlgJ